MPNRSITAAANGPMQPYRMRLIETASAMVGARPVEFLLERHHQDAGRRADAGGGQQHQAGDADDDPAVMKLAPQHRLSVVRETRASIKGTRKRHRSNSADDPTWRSVNSTPCELASAECLASWRSPGADCAPVLVFQPGAAGDFGPAGHFAAQVRSETAGPLPDRIEAQSLQRCASIRSARANSRRDNLAISGGSSRSINPRPVLRSSP